MEEDEEVHTENPAEGRQVGGEDTNGVERVCVGDDAPTREEAVGWLETVDAIVGGGEANGAACVCS